MTCKLKTFLQICLVPGKLSNLSSTIIGNSCKILVEWVKPDGGEAIDEYKVLWAPLQMSQAGEESEVIKHETSKSTYCYVINTELVYTSYNVTVLTYNNAGLSMTSTVQSTSKIFVNFVELVKKLIRDLDRKMKLMETI